MVEFAWDSLAEQELRRMRRKAPATGPGKIPWLKNESMPGRPIDRRLPASY